MAFLCIIGHGLTYVVPAEDVPSPMLFFVMAMGVIFWKGIYDDAIRIIEALLERCRQDLEFYMYVGLLDVLLLLVSLPIVWRLPSYGTKLYVIITLPVGVVIVFLSSRRLYHTIQRVRHSS